MDRLDHLLAEIRACRFCEADLPLGPNPILQASAKARLIICGQAPGTRVHKTGIPFNDPSGVRLREWLGLTPEVFYDPSRVNVIPMGFCYPGRDPRGGDLPPRPECARLWHQKLFSELATPNITLAIGKYAQAFHLGTKMRKSVAETVQAWDQFGPNIIPLPHPSPRNRAWFARYPWFEGEVIPAVRARVQALLQLNVATDDFSPGNPSEKT